MTTKVLVAAILALVIALLFTWAIGDKTTIAGISYQNLTNTISIITSLFLLGIAVVLFQKFGGDQYITDKHTQAVIDLVLTISKINFALSFFRGPKQAGALFTDVLSYKERIQYLPHINKDHESYLKSQYATIEVARVLYDIYSNSSNPYLPRKVAETLASKRNLMPLAYTEGEEPKGKFAVIHMHPGKDLKPERVYVLGKNKETILTLDGAVYDLQDVYKVALTWLSDNNSTAFKSLNISKL